MRNTSAPSETTRRATVHAVLPERLPDQVNIRGVIFCQQNLGHQFPQAA